MQCLALSVQPTTSSRFPELCHSNCPAHTGLPPRLLPSAAYRLISAGQSAAPPFSAINLTFIHSITCHPRSHPAWLCSRGHPHSHPSLPCNSGHGRRKPPKWVGHRTGVPCCHATPCKPKLLCLIPSSYIIIPRERSGLDEELSLTAERCSAPC